MICPFCKEDIKDGAILCKFCKSNLSDKTDNVISQAPSEPVTDFKKDIGRPQPYKTAAPTNNYRKLLIVMACGAIVVVAISMLNPKSTKKKIVLTMGDLKSIGNAIESYTTDWMFAPQVESIKELNTSWFVPFYIKELPVKDAWGNLFIYKHGYLIPNTNDENNEQDKYAISSKGPDEIQETSDDIILSDGLYVDSYPTYKRYNNQVSSQSSVSHVSDNIDAREIENSSEYIDLQKWNLVKVNPKKYSGKKIKIRSMFAGINNDRTVSLDIGTENTFDEGIAERVALLTASEYYTFYGEVFETLFSGPALRIDKVE